VIVPCLNEEATVGALMDALAGQTYPRDDMEVLIADGMSEDATRERIAEARERHAGLEVRVVDNPDRNIPAGLNRALAAARGRYVVRLDAHCVPREDYVERSIAALDAGLGDCVGGAIDIVPADDAGLFGHAIASAVAHPIGVGDAKYRYSTSAGRVDTVPFGAFRRELFERLGGFDERLLSNQDYELNARIRRSGGTVWFDPEIRATYFPRPSFSALSRQYWRYGRWKVRMLRLGYADTLRWRQALPPLFVAALGALIVAAPVSRTARRLLALQAGGYALALGAAGAQVARRDGDAASTVGVPAAIATMHLSWGAGFIRSLIERAHPEPPRRP
jgi:succinoglycan biosynthesis protein ExoA